MNKALLHEIISKLVSAWFYSSARDLPGICEKHSQNGVQLEYDPYMKASICTVSIFNNKLTFLLFKDGKKGRVVRFCGVGKNEFFKPAVRQKTIISYINAVLDTYFEL